MITSLSMTLSLPSIGYDSYDTHKSAEIPLWYHLLAYKSSNEFQQYNDNLPHKTQTFFWELYQYLADLTVCLNIHWLNILKAFKFYYTLFSTKGSTITWSMNSALVSWVTMPTKTFLSNEILTNKASSPPSPQNNTTSGTHFVELNYLWFLQL